MSEQDPNLHDSDAEASESGAQDSVQPESQGANREQTQRSAGVWVALVITWAAIAGGSYWAFGEYQSLLQSIEHQQVEEQPTINYETLIDERVDSRVAALKSGLTELQNTQASDIEARLNDVDTQLKQLPAIHQQLNTMSGRVERAVRTSDESWQLAEIEYLLSLAQQRAMLGAEPQVTIRMLDAAADGLSKIDEIATIGVRQAIEDDKLHLRSLEKSDRVQHFMQLTALQNRIADLSFEGLKPKREDSVAAARESGEQDTTNRVVAYVESIIKVRAAVPPKPLRTPEQEGFLRQMLRADFKTMQWAILHGEQAVFSSARDSARELLAWGFDPNSPLVIQFDKTLTEFEELDVSDVKAMSLKSMAAFQAYQAPAVNEGE